MTAITATRPTTVVSTILNSSDITLPLPSSTTRAVRCSSSFSICGSSSSIAPRQVFSSAPTRTKPAASASAGRSTSFSTRVLAFQAGLWVISSHMAFSSDGR
ncbi:hypothetical protein ABZ826_27040 [Streptomyces sp. NPDC047515]|uniref:hypothetical protein n=1 Tax=Streptomyces sp. NPDC047515 TaxID=3155380 RepID=UPI00340979D2